MTSDKQKKISIEQPSSKKTIYIGIYGYTDSIISWVASSLSSSSSINTRVKENTIQENEAKIGQVQCQNCHSWVLERTLPLHENFCLRNNLLCPWGCGQIFQRNDKEAIEKHWHCDQCDVIGNHLVDDEKLKHIYYFHTQHTCDQCIHHHQNYTFSSLPELAQHKQTDCPGRLIICRYCHVS